MSTLTFDLTAPLRRTHPSARRLRERRPRRAGGFTLVELIVAMTVTLLLLVLLVQVFNGASSTWRRSESQTDAYREARGALQIMAHDLGGTLQASYFPVSGNNGTLTATVSNTGAATASQVPTLMLQHYSSAAIPAGYPINEEVYCLTNIPNQGASSLCSVGYFCQWMPDFVPLTTPDVRPRAYALMRQYFDSNATFQNFASIAQAQGTLNLASLFPRTGTGATSVTQLAAYIWDLRFRIDIDLNESTQPDGNNLPPLDHSQPTAIPYNGTAPPYPPRLPPFLEIRFRALSEIAAQRLEGSASGVTQTTWNDAGAGFTPTGVYKTTILPNYQQFILRVPLGNSNPLPTPTPP